MAGNSERRRMFSDGTIFLYILMSECGKYVKFGRSVSGGKVRAGNFAVYSDRSYTNSANQVKFNVYHEWRDMYHKEGRILAHARTIAESHPFHNELFIMNPVLQQYMDELRIRGYEMENEADAIPQSTLLDVINSLTDRVNTLESKIDLLLTTNRTETVTND